MVVLLLAGAGEASVNLACFTEKRYSIDSFSRMMGKRWSMIWFEEMPTWGKKQDLTPAAFQMRSMQTFPKDSLHESRCDVFERE